MSIQTLVLQGEEYVLLPRVEFEKLTRAKAKPVTPATSAAPRSSGQGQVPAIAYARASIAREIVSAMKHAGLSQAALARAARVRPETLSRILNARVTPDEKTVAKLMKATSVRAANSGR